MIKLAAALPAAHRDDAEHARQRIHIDVSGWHHADETFASLPLVQQAIWQARKLRFVYERGPHCDAAERTADPLGLVAKGSAWYLVAAVEGVPRSYRVSRITEAVLLDEACERPKGFDLAAFWESSKASFKASLPRYEATLRVAPAVFPRLNFAGRFARVEPIAEPDEDGWIAVRLRCDVEEMAVEYALSFGANVEVIAPISLRDKVVAMARDVIAFYERPE